MIQRYNEKLPVCSYCLQPGHSSLRCFKKAADKGQTYNGLKVSSSFGGQRKPMKRGTKRMKTESDKTKAKRLATTAEFFRLNPGPTWTCYLQISPHCPVLLTRETVVPEHVKSKARRRDLKFDVTNLKPACSFCNGIKLSLDIEDLVDEFPHLAVYIDA